MTEALCGHSFSASSISAINKSLDEGLQAFAERRLEERYPYLILDARYEKVREAGVILSQAVLVAVAVDEDGRRQILAVELANRESRSSWRDFLAGLKGRGLTGVEFVVSDNHEGLKSAIREVLPEAAWQRCYVHFLGTPSTTSRARLMTTACRSCAGSTTAANSLRCGATSPNGWPSGRANTPDYATGSKTTSRRR